MIFLHLQNESQINLMLFQITGRMGIPVAAALNVSAVFIAAECPEN